MADSTKNLSRRQALKASAGFAGALAALGSGVLPALVQAGSASPSTPTVDGGLSLQSTDEWTREIERALGNTKGKLQPSGVFLVDLPRDDIHGTIFGVQVKPDFAYDSEVTFQRVGGVTVMKFEAALLDMEVNPVLTAWLAQDLQPDKELFTALHNHYLVDSPPIRFMHGFAAGEAGRVAGALHSVLSRYSGTPFGHGEEPPGNPGFDTKKVTQIIGGTGDVMNGVLTVDVERKETIHQRGYKLDSDMEFDSVFNFQSIGGGKVAEIGEYVVLKDEADAVARELRRRGHFVTALHSHELDVQPQFYYLHSWATGSPIELARDTHAALEHTNSKFE